MSRIIRFDCKTLGPKVRSTQYNELAIGPNFILNRAQSRQAIQVLDEARDAVQTIHVGPTYLIAGSVDGHVRTYDLRMGELRSDFIGRELSAFMFV